jgi:hypothetical protein
MLVHCKKAPESTPRTLRRTTKTPLARQPIAHDLPQIVQRAPTSPIVRRQPDSSLPASAAAAPDPNTLKELVQQERQRQKDERLASLVNPPGHSVLDKPGPDPRMKLVQDYRDEQDEIDESLPKTWNGPVEIGARHLFGVYTTEELIHRWVELRLKIEGIVGQKGI